MSPSTKTKKPNNISIATFIGIFCLLSAAILLTLIFRYPLQEELRYTSSRIAASPQITNQQSPVSTDFGIVIPKIMANAPIIADVDSFDSKLYQSALTRGVAHAAGTQKPGEGGNIFLFAHSSGDLFTASRFNSVFYLLHHLDVGDTITLWYRGQSYNYQVSEKKIVTPSSLTYLAPTTHEQLTLMTCWPPGTSLNRLIVVATKVE